MGGRCIFGARVGQLFLVWTPEKHRKSVHAATLPSVVCCRRIPGVKQAKCDVHSDGDRLTGATAGFQGELPRDPRLAENAKFPVTPTKHCLLHFTAFMSQGLVCKSTRKWCWFWR